MMQTVMGPRKVVEIEVSKKTLEKQGEPEEGILQSHCCSLKGFCHFHWVRGAEKFSFIKLHLLDPSIFSMASCSLAFLVPMNVIHLESNSVCPITLSMVKPRAILPHRRVPLLKLYL
jgi:hypothetical protein